MVDVEVEYGYEAEQTDELSIKVGDIIKNVIMSEGGWWEGELNGKKGMFPDNFVKVVNKEPKKEEKKDIQASKRQSVRDLANKLKDRVHDGPAPARKKPVSVKKRGKAIFAYEPENEDELRLTVGDHVDILKQEEEGWWEGIVNGKQGMFPSNFIDVTDESEAAEPTTEKPEPVESEASSLIKGKKVHGVGLGNIFGDGPIKLRSTTGKKPVDRPQEPPKIEKRVLEDPVQKRAKDTKPVERALVRYSYTAENDDELSLTEGDTIIVLDKELEDGGWWKGEVNGKTGVFPDNFVELMKEEPVAEKVQAPVINPTPQPKPKKPPPPAVPPATKTPQQPKLPEKPPVVDHPKPDHVKEEKPVNHQQPSIPSKKPTHPPPLSKKPQKPADTHEDKSKPETSGVGSFEAVEPTTDKLTHLTASRPRGPAKRPPSQVFFQNPKSQDKLIKEEERNGDVKESHWAKEDKAAHIPATVPEKREEVHHKPHSHTGPPPRPAEPAAPSPALQAAIDELRKEMNSLKANTVTKSAFNELKSENERLKQELDNVKTTYSRRLKDIMNEVDDEKKIRLSTQVEIERIRKLVAESHV